MAKGKFRGSARNSVACGKLWALIMCVSDLCIYYVVCSSYLS